MEEHNYRLYTLCRKLQEQIDSLLERVEILEQKNEKTENNP